MYKDSKHLERIFIPLAACVFISLFIGLPAPGQNQRRYRHAIDDPLGRQKSYVYDVSDPYVVRSYTTDPYQLRKIINTGIKRISGIDDPKKAWRYYIHDDDVVALVFSPVGGPELGTNDDLAAVLIDILVENGFKKENLMLVGLEETPKNAEGTRPWHYGWGKKEVDFGSGKDHLAKWLDEVTAIINIPILMDDQIFHLRGAMANLTWPLIKSPAKLYITDGDPFIPEIYNIAQIRGKVRLHIGNCLHIPYYGGPQIVGQHVFEHRSLLFADDPVALDRVGLELLRGYRRTEYMPSGVNEAIFADYLITAEALGLGYYDLNFIEYDKLHPDRE
jgi:hypothetical protein